VGASVCRRSQKALGGGVVAVGREEHVEGALRVLGDSELGRLVVVVGRWRSAGWLRHVVEQRQAQIEVVDERRVVRRGARAQAVLGGGGGGGEDGLLEADTLAAPEAQHLPMHRLQLDSKWRRASALKKCGSASDESGASRSARCSGCASRASSNVLARSTIWVNLGSDARTRAAGHRT
jgi:hypothetical protein